MDILLNDEKMLFGFLCYGTRFACIANKMIQKSSELLSLQEIPKRRII